MKTSWCSSTTETHLQEIYLVSNVCGDTYIIGGGSHVTMETS